MTTDTITTVLAYAASYDLTDLNTVKDELSITDTTNDAWLTRAVTQVSRAVMNTTKRTFAPEFLQDQINVGRDRSMVPVGVRQIQLSRWPVLAITAVVQTPPGQTAITLVSGTDYQLDAENGRLLRLDNDTGAVRSWEPFPLTVSYSAGYGSAVTETQSVPNSGAYVVNVSKRSAFSCNQTVAYANGTVLASVPSSPTQGQYSVIQGQYTFNAADAGQALTFAYCTLDVPDDLVEICLRIVVGRFKAKGRDPSLIQRDTQGIGTERFWFGGAPGQSGYFTPDIAGALDFYRVPMVA